MRYFYLNILRFHLVKFNIGMLLFALGWFLYGDNVDKLQAVESYYSVFSFLLIPSVEQTDNCDRDRQDYIVISTIINYLMLIIYAFIENNIDGRYIYTLAVSLFLGYLFQKFYLKD